MWPEEELEKLETSPSILKTPKLPSRISVIASIKLETVKD